MLALSLKWRERKPPASDRATDTTFPSRCGSYSCNLYGAADAKLTVSPLVDAKLTVSPLVDAQLTVSPLVDAKLTVSPLVDAKLTVSPLVSAPVRESGHVRARLHSVQRCEAVRLQVSYCTLSDAFRDIS